jgi:hypothetical protein
MIRGGGAENVPHNKLPNKKGVPAAMFAYQTQPIGPGARKLAVGKVLTKNQAGQAHTIQPYQVQWNPTQADGSSRVGSV